MCANGCEGSRCPLLPMTHRQHVFFTVSMLVMYGCLLWILLIYSGLNLNQDKADSRRHYK